MSETLPRLRGDLDVMPSPDPEHPGVLLRDPFQYSEAILIVPPFLARFLPFFDGRHGEDALRAAVGQATGDLEVGEIIDHLVGTLRQAGFLDDAVHARQRREREAAFTAAPVREAVHAGTAYPGDAEALRETLTRRLDGTAPAGADPVLGIAAPHVSPEGGWACYRAAYGRLRPEDGERTFVILGTSHYGAPERFGLTRKPFVTPLGRTTPAEELIAALEGRAGAAVAMEDYCHAVEHSIEFQVICLQHRFGPGVRVLPILCGAFVRSLAQGGAPEADAGVRRFLDALGELAAREGERLCWVLGIDLAHMGRRYGDPVPATADAGHMEAVAARDRARINRVAAGDVEGYWALVQENRDDLKWCGAAPLYAFLRAVPQARGELLRYQQWNIDAESVVSFAGLAFRAPDAPSPEGRGGS